MQSRLHPPARFGPFHRRSESKPEENDLICSTSQVWGRPRRNFYAGLVPAVKAWEGELPDGAIGVEFYTDIAPDPWSTPGWPEWSQGRPGVIILAKDELVGIGVVVTIRRDAE
jgi:hypothetical protein